MQLVDTLFWLSGAANLSHCTATNNTLSRLGAFVILVEPFASLAASRKYTTTMIAVYIIGTLASLTFYPTGCTMCTSVSPLGFLRYFTHSEGCKTWLVPNNDGELPLGIRLLHLAGVTYPYTMMRQIGLVHVAILCITWLIGFASDAHGSVWCVANITQGLVMLADPYIVSTLLPHTTSTPPPH